MTALEQNDQAPQFTLQDQFCTEHSLSDALKNGPVLVYFYPKASTPGCTVQACGLRDSVKALASHNVTIFGISPDPVARLKKFSDKQELNFTLLSDEDHSICDKFGIWQLKKFMGKEYMGVVRTSFLINQSGYIEHVFNKFKTKNHHEVVLDYLNR
ncbi:thioredoxin-dependent thiol peroxidase [Parashewanella spongiae]|uniref:thioredoxin-dependent peroxiredoxin n=1 Tax=Parashewanella spongiae TaxID=342950 RepID=A0A3A6TIE1_9GAMM|nr:thioredoxin-dependent thiol peroxidase [Parashewanella spongiae]MCL1079056.1 thioredoxin-dependent thiol peroxidase [Parashewanella spongiae]RJY11412.1 thioredoxin-dependent thiol peroxidase [Parashewanella spongiae]